MVLVAEGSTCRTKVTQPWLWVSLLTFEPSTKLSLTGKLSSCTKEDVGNGVCWYEQKDGGCVGKSKGGGFVHVCE